MRNWMFFYLIRQMTRNTKRGVILGCTLRPTGTPKNVMLNEVKHLYRGENQQILRYAQNDIP